MVREMKREEGSSEGEGLYRYVPAAVVCNIMITLPACAWLPPFFSLFLSLSLSLSLSPSRSLSVFLSLAPSRFPPTRTPGYQAATLFQRPCCREI